VQFLAEIVRLDHAHHRHVAGDSSLAEAVKLVTRAHQSLIWDRVTALSPRRSSTTPVDLYGGSMGFGWRG
jgi:hypothetical protein